MIKKMSPLPNCRPRSATYISYIISYIILCEEFAGKNPVYKGFLKMICEEFAGIMRGICGDNARLYIDIIAE